MFHFYLYLISDNKFTNSTALLKISFRIIIYLIYFSTLYPLRAWQRPCLLFPHFLPTSRASDAFCRPLIFAQYEVCFPGKEKMWRFSWIKMSLNWKWLSRRYTNQINTWLLNLQNQVFICLTKDFLSQFRVQIPNSSAAWVNIPFDVSATYLEVSQPFKCLHSKCSNTLKQFVGFCSQIIWVYMTILRGSRLKG